MTRRVRVIVIALLTSSLTLPSVSGGFFDSSSYSCASRAKICQLSDVKLTTVEDIRLATFRDVRDTLVIESGSIPRFSRELHQKLPNVTDLTIDRLGIEQLYVSRRLVHLSAVGNAIDQLLLSNWSEPAEGSYKMMTLHLSSNKLTELPPLERFASLMILALDGNELMAIDMGAFANLRELRELSLANNRLLTVTTTTATAKPLQLRKLKRLSFGGNALDLLDVHRWEFDSLEELNLTHNSLTRVEGSFGSFPVLKQLELAGNRWYCEWLTGANTQLQDQPIALDQDEPGRCRDVSMMIVGRHCCNPIAIDGNGGLVDTFDGKCAEQNRLLQLLETLDRTIANGSASVRHVLDAQHQALSAQLDALLETQTQHGRDIAALEDGIDRHGSQLMRTEQDLHEKLDRLRRLVNGRWNRTEADDGGDKMEDDATSNRTTPTSTDSNWPQVAARNEKTLADLQRKFGITDKQFKDYRSKSYEHGARIVEHQERLDTLESGLESVKQLASQLKTKLATLEPYVNHTYEYLKRLNDRSDELNPSSF
uniref:Leucine-rich immune protein (Short) n=1 Tax=Anopheles farauti TaxID=69004 RepID=A0A182QIE7_9DIPT